LNLSRRRERQSRRLPLVAFCAFCWRRRARALIRGPEGAEGGPRGEPSGVGRGRGWRVGWMSGALPRVRGCNVRRAGGQGQRSAGALAAPRRRQGALSAGSRRASARSGRAALLLAAKFGGVAGLGVIIAVGLFVIRLLNGPISLPFLVGPIE